jgi:Zn-finger nucleic acid-binding protein
MQCPVCNETLVMTQRNEVEIDYCPKCRGIWLDRGELDKILERAGEHYSRRESFDEDSRKYGAYREGGHGQPYPHKKKKSYLSEFFDFD